MQTDTHGDSGSASRFFYVAKASPKGAAPGCLIQQPPDGQVGRPMRHLIRLIAAPGSLILDPFTAPGLTVVAALQEGCRRGGTSKTHSMSRQPDWRAQHAWR